MKITRIVKRLGKVFTFEDKFKPVHIHEEVEAILEPGDTVDEVDALLFDQITKMIGDDIQRINDAKKAESQSE